jgi:hypothetical protein
MEADVNSVKRPDLITSGGEVFLRRPNGSPAFRLAPPGDERGWAFLAAADFDNDGWIDVALLANVKEGADAWLYRNTCNAERPFSPEPTTKFLVPGVEVCRDGPTAGDWNGDGRADLAGFGPSPVGATADHGPQSSTCLSANRRARSLA